MTCKLIVASGSPSVQKTIQIALPESKFEIHAFEDGLELVKSISQIKPDAVLLGLSLPQKDGCKKRDS